jgi:hypothetical protein
MHPVRVAGGQAPGGCWPEDLPAGSTGCDASVFGRACRAAVVMGLVVVSGACGGGADTGATSSTSIGQLAGPPRTEAPSFYETPSRFRVSAADGIDPVVIVASQPIQAGTPLSDLRTLLGGPDRAAFLSEALAGEDAVAANIFSRGQEYAIDGVLPQWPVHSGVRDCFGRYLSVIDAAGEIVQVVAPGVCGVVATGVDVRWTGDGFDIGPSAFIDAPADRSAEGTVALDRPGQRHVLPGQPLTVDLTVLPEAADMAASMCVDVTVRSGVGVLPDPVGPTTTLAATEPDWKRYALAVIPQVVPDIVLAEAGEPVPLPDPGLTTGPRELTQHENLAVTWSFGPIDLDEHQPDTVTVTAATGEIIDWGASVRHC